MQEAEGFPERLEHSTPFLALVSYFLECFIPANPPTGPPHWLARVNASTHGSCGYDPPVRLTGEALPRERSAYDLFSSLPINF